jgi:primosomal protein N' (replication factor Y) (superfamily II helicase)
MERTTLFAEVLLPLPIPGTFTYRIPFSMNDVVQKGQRVSIQFGSRRVYAGLIMELHQRVPKKGTPKYILSVLDEKPLVNDVQMTFWSWISQYYMCTQGEVMNVAIPSAFKLSSESKILLSGMFKPDSESLTDSEFRITEALMQKKKLSIKEAGQIVGFQKVLPLLKDMIQRQMIFMEEELNNSYKPRMEKYLHFAEAYLEEEALNEVLDQIGKRAPKQMEALMAMMTLTGFPIKNGIPVKKADLQKKLGGTIQAVKALVDKGILIEEEKITSRFNEEESASKDGVVFSEQQQEAYDKLQSEMKDHRVVLLHGVTSSGKTEVYIRLIEDALKQDKQVLYLLPEIALTTQIIQRLRKHFGDEIGVYHSRYNQNERAEVWENVAGLQEQGVHKPYRIVLGPRSAMFLPFENLGLIIVDEEHDQSYKQFDPAPR